MANQFGITVLKVLKCSIFTILKFLLTSGVKKKFKNCEKMEKNIGIQNLNKQAPKGILKHDLKFDHAHQEGEDIQ